MFVSSPSQTPDVDVPSVDVPSMSASLDAGGSIPPFDVDVPGKLMSARLFVDYLLCSGRLRVLAYSVFGSSSWRRACVGEYWMLRHPRSSSEAHPPPCLSPFIDVSPCSSSISGVEGGLKGPEVPEVGGVSADVPSVDVDVSGEYPRIPGPHCTGFAVFFWLRQANY